MESEAEKIAWRNLVQAHVAHKGHDTEGQGSPITQIVLEHHSKKYHEIFIKKKSEAAANDKPVE